MKNFTTLEEGCWYFDSNGSVQGPLAKDDLYGLFLHNGKVWQANGTPQGFPGNPLVEKLPFGSNGTVIKTVSGRLLDLLSSSATHIDLHDIAIVASRIQRWGGNYKESVLEYSVAGHALNCLRLSRALGYPPEAQLAILLHDASESYVGDLVKPMKILCPSYCRVEDHLQTQIGLALGCDFAKYAEEVKTIDNAILVLEKNTIIAGGPEWRYAAEDSMLRIIPKDFRLLLYGDRLQSKIHDALKGHFRTKPLKRLFEDSYWAVKRQTS